MQGGGGKGRQVAILGDNMKSGGRKGKIVLPSPCKNNQWQRGKKPGSECQEAKSNPGVNISRIYEQRDLSEEEKEGRVTKTDSSRNKGM